MKLIDARGVQKRLYPGRYPMVSRQLDTKMTVFTTRADTIYGCTFMLLPPESKLAAELVEDSR